MGLFDSVFFRCPSCGRSIAEHETERVINGMASDGDLATVVLACGKLLDEGETSE